MALAPSQLDRRIRVAHLTPRGVAERALLEARSNELAESILEPLEAGQAELLAAMHTVERLIAASLVEFRQVDSVTADAQRCLRAYFAELNRHSPDHAFDPSIGATANPDEVRPPRGAFVVVYLRGEPVGCGAVKHQPGDVSDVKRMWLSESVLLSGRNLTSR